MGKNDFLAKLVLHTNFEKVRVAGTGQQAVLLISESTAFYFFLFFFVTGVVSQKRKLCSYLM